VCERVGQTVQPVTNFLQKTEEKIDKYRRCKRNATLYMYIYIYIYTYTYICVCVCVCVIFLYEGIDF
jgi:hypothetical protein